MCSRTGPKMTNEFQESHFRITDPTGIGIRERVLL